MIGPFWCEEKKCWVRFTKNADKFIAEVAVQDPTDMTKTKDWQPTKEDYWQVQYQEGNKTSLAESYRLLEGDLYRATIARRFGKEELIINTYNHLTEQPVAFKLNENNPFINKNLQKLPEIKAEELPLTPEAIKKRLNNWLEWQKRTIGDGLNLEALSTFNPNENKAIIKDLGTHLSELAASKYSSPELYQNALREATSIKESDLYKRVEAFGIIDADFDSNNSKLAIEITDTSSRRTAFAFEVLKEELNQLQKNFNLKTVPESIPNPIPHIDYIDAVEKAVQKYHEWYSGKKEHRGANGWFTWIRHGLTGQHKANLFLNNINSCKTLDEAIQQINDFLKDTDTRYHRHSFSSFLLDELIPLGQPWETIPAESGIYDQQQVISILDSDQPKLPI